MLQLISFLFVAVLSGSIFADTTAKKSPRELREEKRAQEFAAALSKSQGKRLTDVQIEEVKGLSTYNGKVDGINEITGNLTPQGIFMVLQQLKVIGAAKDADNADEALKIKRGQTGAYSDQLYIVHVEPSYLQSSDLATTYVIKGSRDLKQVSSAKQNTPQKELQDLEKVKQFIVSELQGTDIQIATAGGAAWYLDMQNRKRYLVVLTIASGQSIDDWTDQCLQGVVSEEKWQNMMKTVGEVVGKLHFTLATLEAQENLKRGEVNWDTFKTIIHGDLHIGNIFYDEATNQVTLIDTASMADSMNHKKSPIKDIADIYLKTKYWAYFNNKKRFLWLNKGFQTFAEGYTSAFPQPAQAAMKEALMNLYKKWSSGVLDYIIKNGFTEPKGKDTFSQILGDIIIQFTNKKLTSLKVKEILSKDEMASK